MHIAGSAPSWVALNGFLCIWASLLLWIEFEASKLPLDVAVFNSTRACGGGDEKIRKYLQAVLVIGGTSLLPGMAHALESR